MKTLIALISACSILAAATLPAQANVFGNPVPGMKSGEAMLQASLSSDTRQVFLPGLDQTLNLSLSETMLALGFAIGDKGLLGFKYGLALAVPSGRSAVSTGSEGGFFYRHMISDPGSVRHGLALSYHWGGVGDDTSTEYFSQIDVSYGISFKASPETDLYVAGLFSTVSGSMDTYYAPYYSYALESTMNLGAYAGVEYKASSAFVLGVEARLLASTGLAAFAQARF